MKTTLTIEGLATCVAVALMEFNGFSVEETKRVFSVALDVFEEGDHFGHVVAHSIASDLSDYIYDGDSPPKVSLLAAFPAEEPDDESIHARTVDNSEVTTQRAMYAQLNRLLKEEGA